MRYVLVLLVASHLLTATTVDTLPKPLKGTVHLADGSPAAGATVWAAKFTYGPLVRSETVADDNGKYTLDLEPGEWYLWARHGTQEGEGPARHETVVIAAERARSPSASRNEAVFMAACSMRNHENRFLAAATFSMPAWFSRPMPTAGLRSVVFIEATANHSSLPPAGCGCACCSTRPPVPIPS